jgi:hypothetical protein
MLVAAAAGFTGAPQPPSPFTASIISKPRNFSANPLAGRNIFQLKAAVDTVEKQTAPEAPAQPVIVELPTSDDSEKLLRIRHSVGDCNQTFQSRPSMHLKKALAMSNNCFEQPPLKGCSTFVPRLVCMCSVLT